MVFSMLNQCYLIYFTNPLHTGLCFMTASILSSVYDHVHYSSHESSSVFFRISEASDNNEGLFLQNFLTTLEILKEMFSECCMHSKHVACK